MQVTLFRALQSIKVSDELAEQTVDALEDYTAMKMNEVTAPCLLRLKVSTHSLLPCGG